MENTEQRMQHQIDAEMNFQKDATILNQNSAGVVNLSNLVRRLHGAEKEGFNSTGCRFCAEHGWEKKRGDICVNCWELLVEVIETEIKEMQSA